MKKARAEHFKVRGWPLVLSKYFSFTSIIILQVFLYNITVLQLPYCLNLIESSNCNVFIDKMYQKIYQSLGHSESATKY